MFSSSTSSCRRVVRATMICVAGAIACMATSVAEVGADAPKYVTLDRGAIGSSEWAAFADGEGASGSGRDACLDLSLATPSPGHGYWLSESHQCNAIGTRSVIESVVNEEGPKNRTVEAVLVSPLVQTLYVTLSGRGGRRSVQLRSLGSASARRLGISPFGYWIRGFSGHVCLRRVMAYGSDKALIDDSGRLPCG